LPDAERRVVLLHSALGDSRLWAREVELLRGEGFDAVAPDLPGFGREPMPREPFSFVERVTELLPAVLVGNSFGGGVALRTALAHPERVPRLVLVAAGVPDHEFGQAMQEYWRREAELIDAGELDAATELNLEFWVAPEHRDEVRPQQRRALELQTAHEEPALEWPEPRPLSELSMPTLVIVGENDQPDFMAIGRRIVAEAPDARLEVVPGAGHLVALDAPDALHSLLLEFLGSPPGRS
jgi:pimeloyl-ACP methyl ester carboxylesterase